MKKHNDPEPLVQDPKPSRGARLYAMLFTTAALGTTLLTMGALAEPKVPRLVGE